MVFIPEGFTQATVNYSGPTRSGRGATVLGFVIPSGLDLADVASNIWGSWDSNLRGTTHDSWRLDNVTCVTETEGVVWGPSTSQGTRSGAMSPPNVTVLMKKITVQRGRAFRGRSYWPGMLNDDDVYDDGNINPSRINSIRSDLDDFFSSLSALGINQMLLHNDAELPATSVSSITVEPKVATQRRRLR